MVQKNQGRPSGELEEPIQWLGALDSGEMGHRQGVGIKKLRGTDYDLKECVKELQCIYDISGAFEKPRITFDQICQEVADLLPSACKHPEAFCARITIGEKMFKTANYRESNWRRSSDLIMHGSKVGFVEVSYLEAKPTIDEESFCRGKRLLLDIIAERLGRAAERVEAQEALQQSEERYRLLADNVSDVIWTMDMNMRFTYFSPSVTRLRGHTVEEAMAQTLKEMLVPGSYRVAMRALKEELSIEDAPHKDPNRSLTLELKEVRKDGSTIWAEVKMSFLRDQMGKAVGIMGVTRNITDRKQAEEIISQLAYYDTVTSLPNRTLLNDRVNMAMAQVRRDQQALAVMMLDLDRFKDVNDRLGHEVGDQLLKSVGERLIHILRKTDTAARIGGDEFVILLPKMSRVEYANTVAKKITSAFRKPFVVGGHELRCTASIGIATYPSCGESAEELIKNADAAMYHAKELGRDRYEVFTSEALGIVGH